MNKVFNKVLMLLIALVMCVGAFAACGKEPTPPIEGIPVDPNEAKYEEAFDLLEAGDYEAAYALFTELGDYKDAKAEASKFFYVPTFHTVTRTGEEGVEISNFSVTYNENNVPAKVVQERNDGFQHTCICTYNENNRLLGVSCTDTEGVIETYDCEYDDKGNLIKATFIYDDDTVYIYEYAYNEKGEKIKVALSDESGAYNETENFYDENGLLIREVLHAQSGVYTTEYFYDENGNKTLSSIKDADGVEVAQDIWVYDEQGRNIRFDCVEDGEIVIWYEYEYDENDNLISEHVYYSSSLYCKRTLTYDENGNEIKEVVENDDGSVKTVESEYKLVYLPYNYTEDEWTEIFSATKW